MRTFRCHVCEENVKRRRKTKYVYCRSCHQPICVGCSVQREVPRPIDRRIPGISRSQLPTETKKETWCRHCVAEEVLST